MLFTNIREPTLFYYRRSQENASSVNRERDNQIVHNIMKNHYQSEWDIELNPIQLEGLAFATAWKKGQAEYYTEMLQQINELFCQLINKNKTRKIYDQYALYESIFHKWKKIFTHIKNANGGFNKIPAKIKETYKSSKFYQDS